jgi:hypothetical protein
MPKKRTATALALRSNPAPMIVVRQSSKRRRAGAMVRHVGRHTKRAGKAVGGALWKQKTTLAAVGGAGLVGYLEGAGHLEFIPDVVPGMDSVGRTPTIALASYAAGALFKQQWLKHAGVGLAASAAFSYGLDKGKTAKK